MNLLASAAHHEVKISRGWRAFASSNDLKKGDLLLFSLTAMSKFVVYICDFAGSLIKEPRRARPLTSSYKICGCNCQDCKANWHWMSKNLPRNKQNEEASEPSLSLSNKETLSRFAMHPGGLLECHFVIQFPRILCRIIPIYNLTGSWVSTLFAFYLKLFHFSADFTLPWRLFIRRDDAPA